MKANPIEVGCRIRSIRLSRGLTMEEFGRRIGVIHKANVNTWEKGVNLPNPDRLKIIAEFAGIKVDELLYGSEQSTPSAIGNRIKLIRLENQMNTREFGEKIDNTSDSIVSRWENGKSLPNAQRLKMIADLGGLSISELLQGKPKGLSQYSTDELLQEIKRRTYT